MRLIQFIRGGKELTTEVDTSFFNFKPSFNFVELEMEKKL